MATFFGANFSNFLYTRCSFFQDLVLLLKMNVQNTPHLFGAVCDSLIEDVKPIVKHFNPVSSLLITKKTSQCRSCGV